MESILSFKVFLIPALVGIIVQLTKFIIYCMKNGWDIRYAMTHGHMPSTHTGFAIALITSIGYYEGIHSGTFAVSVALAILIVDDAVRLRMYLGDQGRYLNMLIRQLNINEEQFPRLKERVGHRISEVIIGGIYGFILTLALIYLTGIA